MEKIIEETKPKTTRAKKKALEASVEESVKAAEALVYSNINKDGFVKGETIEPNEYLKFKAKARNGK